MRMEKKVCFPCYGGSEFGSLQEAVNRAQEMPGGLYVYIVDIVMYNVSRSLSTSLSARKT